METKRLFLLDAYALIFRAYYALIRMPRMTRAGFNTSAIFGFVNTLEELIRKENPTHIAVCFDPQGPTFRHEAFENYKGEREATPEDIKLAIPWIKKIIEAYNIPVIEVPGFEADDVIGTLSKRADAEGFVTYMMTPDKDFGQLVSANVLQYKPSYRGQDFEIRGEKEVCERYGLQNTTQVIDLLALMGDKVDNIPGCPGIGEKTAIKLISEFGNVENLIDHVEDLKGTTRKKIEENVENIRFSKFLATIRTDVPMDIDPDSLTLRKPDTEKLFALFRELEFRTLEQRVAKRLDPKPATQKGQASLFDFDETPESEPIVTRQEEVKFRIVDSPEQLDTLNRSLADSKSVAIFLVADGITDMASTLCGAAIAAEGIETAYIPVTFKEGVSFILDLFARRDILKISTDAKRDYVIAHNLRNDDEQPLANYYDISLAHYLLQPETRHSVDDLAADFLHISLAPLPENSKRKNPPFETYDTPTLASWSCARADAIRRIYPLISEKIEKEGFRSMLYDIELPLSVVLADMEIAGVRIDPNALHNAADEMTARMADLEKEIHDLAGMQFNVGSPSKVGEVLFDHLKLDDKAKKTKTGSYTTSEDVLEKIAWKHPIVNKILLYRQLKKLVSTYLTALPEAINPETGRVHTNYNQTVTATGRLSSSNPNLQNIPIREELGRDIRRAFIASPGCLFLSADYSQIELRLVADFADDPVMIEAFRNGSDIHAITASKIYNKPLEEVSADERRHAKTANFGILYGISAFGLASRLGIPRAQAKDLIDGYFKTFPTIRQFMDDSVQHAREKGYVTTQLGRRRMLPDINSRNAVVRGYAERNAINAPIQGTAADIIKIAMVNIAARLKEENLKTRMIMQVHDELNFDVPENELPRVQEIVQQCMTDAYHGKVPMEASMGAAGNWLDAH